MLRVSLNNKSYFMNGCSALAMAATGIVLCGPAAWADDDVPMETVVVTGTKFEVGAAPAKASIDTMQPQTIIDRSYIEDFTAPGGDYVSILAIAPSLTGTSINGPGLSDGNVKNTLRGLPDGSYGMSFDNIPFGDTNGPSHHSLSYFPGSIIGSVLVDRGPGNAGTLGAATYGGTIKLYSEQLDDKFGAKGELSFGSFNTKVFNANIQSGSLADIGGTRIMANVMSARADGALSFNTVLHNNYTAKADHTFGDNWKVTLFGTHNYIAQTLNDSNGATPAQVAAYGKSFALQNTNPKLSTYTAYNWTTKQTDLEYIRLQGNVTDGLKIDNTAYSYFYSNHTFSARNILQTSADIAANTTQGQGGKLSPIVNGVVQPNDVPGYKKMNRFRVWGDILRASQDFEVSSITGQVRAGLWWEGQITQRFRYDYDVTSCINQGINPWNSSLGPAQTSACWDSSLGAAAKLLPNGIAEFDEHTSWYQYQPFVEVELHPFDGLTITPGFKYIDWLHKTNAIVEPKLLKPLHQQFTTKESLPFIEANYKILPNWSLYAQYAKGVYVPDITTFQQAKPVSQFPASQISTNYQVGTVYYADNFSVDVDLYYIPITNNYVSQSCALLGGLASDTCFVNIGRATYKGIEGEGTYAFDKGGVLEGLSVFANGSIMSSKSGGKWLQQAPAWTAAAGVIYKNNGWKASVIDKTTGSQYMDNAETINYKVGTFSTVNATVGYGRDFWELSLDLNNALNSRNVVAIKVNDKTFQTNRLNSLDQYYYLAPRSVMGTAKVHF